MSLRNYISLGRSGLRVSPACLGTMVFGEASNFTASEEASFAMLDHYIEQGGNFIDTANIYTSGLSESIIGKYVAERDIRDKLVIATKFAMHTDPNEPNAMGNGRKHMHQALDASLKRLKMDYVDLYWMHAWDTITPAEEVLDSLNDLVRQGKIRYFGLSDVPAWYATRIHSLAERTGKERPIALQLEYNMIARSIENEHIPAAQQFGWGVTPWSPLAMGLLAGKFTRDGAEGRAQMIEQQDPSFAGRTERTFAIIDALASVANELGRSPAQVAINWLAIQPGVTSPILGARTLDQLVQNLAAFDFSIPAELRQKLDEVSAVPLVQPYSLFKPSGNYLVAGTVSAKAWAPAQL